MKRLYRAQGYITVPVATEYKAESQAEAEALALSYLIIKADDIGIPGDIEDIEVELSED